MSDFVEIKKILADMNKELSEVRSAYQEKARKTLNDAFKVFFDTVPELSMIRWTQYTPYFNDGDVCEFSVNEPSFFIDQEEFDECDDVYEHNPFAKPNSWVYENVNKSSYYKEEIDKYEAIEAKYGIENINRINNACNDFISIFHSIEDDVLLDLFGDHVEVIATKSGFEVDEYSHD